MSGANGRSSLDGANPDDQPIEAPWAKTGVLTRDLTAGGIVYLEMPLAALERGLDLIRQVRSRLPQVSVPVLLISGDRDAIVEKANGPYVLEHVGSSDKRLLALPDSSHEVTLDYTGNGSRSKSTTSSGRARELTLAR